MRGSSQLLLPIQTIAVNKLQKRCNTRGISKICWVSLEGGIGGIPQSATLNSSKTSVGVFLKAATLNNGIRTPMQHPNSYFTLV